MPRKSRLRAAINTPNLLILLTYGWLLLTVDHTIGGDARYRFDDLDNLLRHGDWKPLKAEASGFSAIGHWCHRHCIS
jgi:hypothetical protein